MEMQSERRATHRRVGESANEGSLGSGEDSTVKSIDGGVSFIPGLKSEGEKERTISCELGEEKEKDSTARRAKKRSTHLTRATPFPRTPPLPLSRILLETMMLGAKSL